MKILFATLALGCCCVALAADDRPNILIIVADDLGYEAVGAYGGLSYNTPQLDRMAADGLLFTSAYTSPVCTPSRVSLHTSLYTSDHGRTSVIPVHNGTTDFIDFTVMPTFAQLLRAEGYQTSVTGKWQLATWVHHPNHLIDSGFDSWCIWQIWSGTEKTTRYWQPYFNRDGEVMDDISDRFGPDVLGEYVTERMTQARDDNEPFLIVHNMLLPHWPIVQTPDDIRLNRPASLANMVEYMDKLVGQLLDGIDELGLRESTYVIFIGDNGTETTDIRQTVNGLVQGGKRDLADVGAHIPFLVWGPSGMGSGRVINDLVDITDIFPTVCALAGVEISAAVTFRGTSIAPQLHGRAGVRRTYVHHGIHNDEAVFDGSWRLLRSGRLYDVRNLPAEVLVPPGDPIGDVARRQLSLYFDLIDGDDSGQVHVVVDDSDDQAVEFEGEWQFSNRQSGHVGAGYSHDRNELKGSKAITYSFTAPTSGEYALAMRWTENPNRATNVPVTLTHKSDVTQFTVNQRENGERWNSLGQFRFSAGETVTVRIETTGTDGFVIADAVRFSIVDSTLSWRMREFGIESGADPLLEDTLWGDLADPDADGIANILEFYLGLEPLGNDLETSRSGWTFPEHAESPQWRFNRIVGVDSNVFSSEVLVDTASGWLPLERVVEEVEVRPLNAQFEEVTVQPLGDSSEPERLLLRHTVILP